MNRQKFQRLILPTDWHRFEMNAMRIRRFGYPSASFFSYFVGKNVYAALACASMGKTPLLPRLRNIYWEKWRDDEYPYISLFLSPSIQTCTLVVNGNSDAVQLRLSLLPSLVWACPHVTHLILNGSSSPPWKEMEKALSALRHWSSLQHLDLRSFPDASMLCVAKFPVLRKLTIGSPRQTGQEHLPMHVKGFTKLEYLKISCSRIEFLVELVSCMSQTPLQTLQLEFGHDPKAGQLSDLFMAMRRNISRSSLRHICISYNPYRTSLVEEERSITLRELSPLLAFTNLLEVSITINFKFHLNKKNLRIMTSSWPHLRTLNLTSLRPSEYWPQISIHDFTSFLGYCPLLEELTIAFDALEVALSAEKPVRYEKIRALGVLHSPIGDPGKVAAFLSGIFPNLCSIDVFNCKEPGVRHIPDAIKELERKWKEVGQLVKLFSLVRMQEKKYRLANAGRLDR